MKLLFTLLVVDDNPSNVNEATYILKEHLDEKGFDLDRRDAPNLSGQSLKNLARSEGRDYDLVMIDYNLGLSDINGATAAQRLRHELPYTDIVFYSSNPTHDLHDKLAEEKVSGVFIARRDELDNALIGLADTVIGKAIDLNHMRGIGMAEVAEMDLLMEDTLKRAFGFTDEQITAAAERTLQKLQESLDGDVNKVEDLYQKHGLSGVVSDSRIFSSTCKFRAVRRIATHLNDVPSSELEILKSYEDEVIRNRNMLAHVKEGSSEEGKVILESLAADGIVVIDDSWMTNFRRQLRKHREALASVCRAINDQLGAVEAGCDPEKNQS